MYRSNWMRWNSYDYCDEAENFSEANFLWAFIFVHNHYAGLADTEMR
jgi:hypothetical protein